MPVEPCTPSDAQLLAAMNKQLIEDEKSDNPMDGRQLEQRMRTFLETEYRAYFYRVQGEIAGYALVRMSASPLYLRQFFICRAYRRKGHGRAFFFELIKELGAKEIDIEVFCWNEAGIGFWRSLGFEPRSVSMRRPAK